MEQERRRRSTGKVDRLPPELKDTVEQMLLTGCTYKEIVAFLKANGEEMSQMAICTYARKYLATVEMINVAQSNFSMLMDEMNRYPDLFVRCHASYLVNPQLVSEIRRFRIRLQNGIELPVPEKKYMAVKTELQKRCSEAKTENVSLFAREGENLEE